MKFGFAPFMTHKSVCTRVNCEGPPEQPNGKRKTNLSVVGGTYENAFLFVGAVRIARVRS
jgi:hypothetical protein